MHEDKVFGQAGGGIFFTEDKADNIHCVKTSGTGKTAKTGRYRSNDDRY